MISGTISRGALVAALCLAGAAPALAEDDTDAPIVVTAQSLEVTLPQELAEYGNDMAVVSEKQIKDTASVDVVQALANVPGLYIRAASGPFSYVDVSIQGSRTQDVLWTMDGIRLNNRLYGGTSPNDTLPASMIERIEVLKGGESLFYGTQASGGIINVITRGFTDDFNGQVNASIDSRVGTSFDGYFRGSFGGHRFVVYGARYRADGYRPYSIMQPSATDRERGYNLWTAGIKYQYDLAPDLALNLQYQHTKADLDNLSATRTRKSRNDRNEEIASARLDYTGDDGVQFFLKGYFHDWKTAYVQIRNPIQAGPPITVYPAGTFWGYRDWGGSAVVKLHPHAGLEYLIGYDYQNFSGRDDVLLIAPTREQVHAGILQIRTTDELSSKGKLAAGLRYNKGQGSKKTIWNFSGRYNFSDALFLQANVGTSFVLPDASQLFGNDDCCEIGNPNLKPEESRNINISAGGKIASAGGISWQVTYFNRSITNLIDTTYDDPAFPNGTYINVNDKVKMAGAEAQFSADFGNGLTLTASYTYSKAYDKGSDLQRDRSPRQFAKSMLAYDPDDKPFGANLAVNWAGDTYSTLPGFGRLNYGNYVVVDAGAHVYLDGANRRHRVGLNIQNLFDKEYSSTGYRTAVTDDGVLDGSNSRFLYYGRGVPRTVLVSYGLSF